MVKRHNGFAGERVVLAQGADTPLGSWHCLTCGAKIARVRRPYCLDHSAYAQALIADRQSYPYPKKKREKRA